MTHIRQFLSLYHHHHVVVNGNVHQRSPGGGIHCPASPSNQIAIRAVSMHAEIAFPFAGTTVVTPNRVYQRGRGWMH